MRAHTLVFIREIPCPSVAKWYSLAVAAPVSRGLPSFCENNRAALRRFCHYVMMAHGIQNLIDRTRILAGLARGLGLSDRQLLEQFAEGDEAAFTTLVDRHGGLVMGVCRRVLQHTQDAEDAFQATFMVLARKAGKIAWHHTVAN